MKRRCSGTATSASTLFPVLWYDCAQVLLGAQTLGKLFFSFLNHGLHEPHGFLPTRKGKDSGANGDSAVYYFAQAFGVCARPLAPFFEVASDYKRCEDASQFHSASRDGGQAARNFKLMSRCEPL